MLFKNQVQLLYWLALFALFAFFLIKIASWPVASGDEIGLLNIPHRALFYHDIHYPVFSSAECNAEKFRCYPPIVAFSVRVLWHLLVGFSDFSSRILSAIMLLVCIFIISTWAKKISNNNYWFALLTIVLIGCVPSVIISAKSVRFEQEVLFLGILGTFGISLLLTSYKKINRYIYFISGLFCLASVTSHSYGCIFLISLLASFLLNKKGWNKLDGLNNSQRLTPFIIGGLIIIFISLLPLIYDGHAYLEYIKSVGMMYNLRKQQFVDLFYTYPFPFKDFLPRRIIAGLVQVNYYSFIPDNLWVNGIIKKLYYFLFWAVSALMLLSIPVVYKNKNNVCWLPVSLAFFLSLTTLVFTIIYPPNQTYHLYLSFSLVVYLVLLTAAIFSQPAESRLLKIIRYYIRVIIPVFLATNILFCVLLTTFLSNFTASKVDNLFNVFLLIKQQSNFENTVLPVLTDTVTWPVAGRKVAAIYDAISNQRIDKFAGLAFEDAVLKYFVDYLPSLSQQQLTVSAKEDYMQKLISSLHMSGLIISPTVNDFFRVYTAASFTGLHVFMINVDGSLDKEYNANEFPLIINKEKQQLRAIMLPAGLYLLKFPVTDNAQSPLFIAGNNRIQPINQSLFSNFLHSLYLINITQRQASLIINNVNNFTNAKFYYLTKS